VTPRMQGCAGHAVLQMEALHGRGAAPPPAARAPPPPAEAAALGAPLFRLAGLAIGNGLTDPPTQARPTRVGLW